MSVETLRKAAELLRRRASTATPGPWSATDRYPLVVLQQTGGDGMVSCNLAVTPAADAAYIASVHPLVGLAVADLLDRAAREAETYEQAEFPELLMVDLEAELAVARAILGERVP